MRLFSMYRWVRERHMIGIRGRNFMEVIKNGKKGK